MTKIKDRIVGLTRHSPAYWTRLTTLPTFYKVYCQIVPNTRSRLFFSTRSPEQIKSSLEVQKDSPRTGRSFLGYEELDKMEGIPTSPIGPIFERTDRTWTLWDPSWQEVDFIWNREELCGSIFEPSSARFGDKKQQMFAPMT